MSPSFTCFDVFLYDFILYSLNIRNIPRLDGKHVYDDDMYSDRHGFGFLSGYKYITYEDISIIEELFR